MMRRALIGLWLLRLITVPYTVGYGHAVHLCTNSRCNLFRIAQAADVHKGLVTREHHDRRAVLQQDAIDLLCCVLILLILHGSHAVLSSLQHGMTCQA